MNKYKIGFILLVTFICFNSALDKYTNMVIQQEHQRRSDKARGRAEYQVNEYQKKSYQLGKKSIPEFVLAKTISWINGGM